jgi:hypothetical protein
MISIANNGDHTMRVCQGRLSSVPAHGRYIDEKLILFELYSTYSCCSRLIIIYCVPSANLVGQLDTELAQVEIPLEYSIIRCLESKVVSWIQTWEQ